MRNTTAVILYDRTEIIDEVVDYCFGQKLVFIQTQEGQIKLFLYVNGTSSDLTYLSTEISEEQRKKVIASPAIAHLTFIEQVKSGAKVDYLRMRENVPTDEINELLSEYLPK